MKTPLLALPLGLAVLLFSSGCAVQPRSAYTPLDARGELSLPRGAGKVALTVIDPASGFNDAQPDDRQGAAGFVAREAMLDTLRTGGEGAILFPAAFVLGGISGAVFGVGEAEAKSGAEAIARANREAKFEAQLAAALAQTLSAHGATVERIADDLPVTAPPRTRRLVAESDGRRRWVFSERAAHPLRDSGRDVLLGVRVVFQGFQRAPRPSGVVIYPRDAVNPPLALLFAVNVTALQVSDWNELGGVSIVHTSRPRTFTDWAANDARELRREIEQAAREIRGEIAARITLAPAAADAPEPSERSD